MGKTKKGDQVITIKTDELNPEPVEIIAQEIIKIANAFEVIQKSRLAERAVILLLCDLTGLNQGTIKKVLTAGPYLKKHYIKNG